MTANKPQFDVLLGGTENLPVEFSVGRFASARAQEIAALTQAIEDPQRTSLVFQKLPKHMRRRIMSRTSKRLPRRLREAHMHQLRKSGLPPEPKRPSRKFRRRPGNILLEYNRRQKRYVWLETHLWHAKRFHMIEKWGYKLADFPNDKSFRACYRAMANHCLLQDISYYSCIELNGPVDELLRHLHKLTNKECGLTFGAKAFLDGMREGSVMLFHQNTFPYGAIGVVSFLWKPSEEIKSDNTEISETRTLWMWVHPAFYQELLDELILLFNFTAVKNEADTDLNKAACHESFAENAVTSDSKISEETTALPAKKKCKPVKVSQKERKLDIEKTKLETRNIPFIKTPKYCSDNGSVKMVLLKDTLNRFRLTGPLSQAVLLESLHIANILEADPSKNKPNSEEEEEKSSVADKVCLQSSDVSTDDCKTRENVDWWTQFYGESQHHKQSWYYQTTLWQSLKGAASPAQLPPHLVLALTILDPRLQLPSKRTKAVPDEKALWGQESEEQITSLSSLASVSPIWSSHVRDLATSSKMSSAELADVRSRNLVPGFMLEEFEHSFGQYSSNVYPHDTSLMKSCVPILLIQRPGSQDPAHKRLGFSSGWDMVMPAGWALPLWLALLFRGARAGGLRESRSLGFEMGSESILPPDTLSGSNEAEAQRMQLTERYFRFPPDKRPNYVKLGITSPFICSWDVLVNDWSHRTSENLDMSSKPENQLSACNIKFFVIRERKKLEYLKTAITGLNTNIRQNSQNARNSSELAVLFPGCTHCCLVPVTIHMCGTGSPIDFAIICLPSETDVDIMSRNPHDSGPTEQLHTDKHQTERKELQTEHKQLLKRLRRKRVREKRKLEDLSAANQDTTDDKHIVAAKKRKANEPPPTKDLTDKHEQTLRSLWLPQTRTVKESCSRTVIGFIMKAAFSFTESKGSGQGYVVLSALLELVALYESKLREGNKMPAPWVLVRNPTSLQYRFGVLNIPSAM